MGIVYFTEIESKCHHWHAKPARDQGNLIGKDKFTITLTDEMQHLPLRFKGYTCKHSTIEGGVYTFTFCKDANYDFSKESGK